MIRVAKFFILLMVMILPTTLFGEEWSPQPRVFLRADGRQATILANPGGENPTEIRIALVHGNEILHRYQSPDGESFSAFLYERFSPNFIITGNMAGEISFWSSFSSHPTNVIQAHNGPIQVMAASPFGGTLVSGGRDGRALVMSTRPRQIIHELKGHEGPVTGVSWLLPRRVVTACEDGRLRVFDPISGAHFFTSPREDHSIVHLRADFGPDQLAVSGGRYVFATTADGKGHLWDFRSTYKLATISATVGKIRGGIFFRRHYFIEREQEVESDPVTLLTWTDRGEVDSWRVPSGVHLERFFSAGEGIVDMMASGPGLELFVLLESGNGMVVNSTRKSKSASVDFSK